MRQPLSCCCSRAIASSRPFFTLGGVNERFVVSLLAENQYRVQHLEGAVRRLDERLEELATRARSLRQEEINEEIEMILLGTRV